MDRRAALGTAAAFGAAGLASLAGAQPGKPPGDADREPTELFLLWTSPDAEVAHRMALMYAHAAKRAGWYDRVRLIAWGPSQKLIVADKDVRAKLMAMKDDGVSVEACIACAQTYGLVDDLRALGLPVLGQGDPLSRAMKDPAVSVLSV